MELSYHERVERLLEGTRRLHETVKALADTSTELKTVETPYIAVDNSEQLATDYREQAAQQLHAVKEEVTDVAALVDGIDIDALLNDVPDMSI